MLFFSDLGQTPSIVASDAAMAVQLRQAIVSKCACNLTWNKKQWSLQFAGLRKRLDDLSRIQTTLDWYCEHLGQPYTPYAFCAKTFVKKFLQIEVLAKRPVAVSVTELDPILLRTIQRLGWPRLQEQTLPASIQLTLQQRHGLLEKQEPLLQKPKTHGFFPLLELAKQVRVWLSNELDFTVRWYEQKQKQVRGWADWSGNALSLSFRQTGKEFIALVNQWSRELIQSDKPAKEYLTRLQLA